jgi:hypothetical protein
MAFKILGRDGTQIVTAGATADSLSAEARKLINVADPVDPQDAATRTWVESAISGASSTPLDGTFRIKNTADNTRQMAFDVAAIAASTTRTVIMPNSNVDLGLVATALQTSQLGAVNGVASLDSNGKIPSSQLTLKAFEFNGSWNASTNSPSLADGAGNSGDVYYVSVAGTQNLGSGSIAYSVGDWVYYDGVATIWRKADNVDEVTSVNGQTGAVVLTTDNVNEGASNFYYTSTRFNTSFSAKSTDDLTEGSTNLYFTASRVRSTVLTGLSTSSSDSVTSADTVLAAIGKLQARTKKPNLGASSNPTTGDDGTQGYEIGSLWYNQSTDKLYIAESVSTGAAVWTLVNPTAPVTSVNSQTGAVSLTTDNVGEGVTNLYFTPTRAKTAAVADSITDGVTDIAPSQNAVYDALALKASASDVTTLQGDSGKSFESGVAGESMASDGLFLVRRAKNGETAGRYYLAKADSAINSRVVGYIMVGGTAVSAGDTVRVYKLGSASLGSSDTPFGGTTGSNAVYLDQSTAGKWTLTPTETAGSWIKEVGFVGTTTILEFQPGILVQA